MGRKNLPAWIDQASTVTFPRLSPDLPDYCPVSKNDLLEHLHRSQPDEGRSRVDDFKFLRTALVDRFTQYWIWRFNRNGETDWFATVSQVLGGSDSEIIIRFDENKEEYSVDQYLYSRWVRDTKNRVEAWIAQEVQYYLYAAQQADKALLQDYYKAGNLFAAIYWSLNWLMPLIFGVEVGIDEILNGEIESVSEKKVVVQGDALLLFPVGGHLEYPIYAELELTDDSKELSSYILMFADCVVEKDAEYVSEKYHGERIDEGEFF